MPYSHLSIISPGINILAPAIAVIESGTLIAVSIFPLHTPTGYYENYGDIMICSTITPTPMRLALLAFGQFGRDLPLSWTGRIPCEPHFAVRARATSINPLSLNFTFVTITEHP